VTEPAKTPDPWRSFRGIMAGVLVLEAIVVLLALPVASVAGGGLSTAAAAYLIGMAAVLVVLSGLQRWPWAIWVNLAVQAAVMAGFALHPAIGFIGVLFAAVWLLLVYLRAEVMRRQKQGLLPGQQQPPDAVD
jgi:hypothetical protein